MATQTPFHLKRIFLINSRHIVNLSVTGRTTYTFGDVNTVIKIRILRKIMNPLPFNRFVVTKARLNRFQIRRIGPHLIVAIHTGLCRRNTCRSGVLNSRMAIPAIDTVIADMMPVTKLHRLLFLQISSGQIGRTRNLRVCIKRTGAENYRHSKTCLCDIIRSAMKELCHVFYLTIIGYVASEKRTPTVPGFHNPKSNKF